MKKLTIPVLLLITIVLLILFALLPKLISCALDIKLSQTPSYSDMLSIQLNMDTEQSLSTLDKLAFLSVAETTNTTQDQMSMTEDEAIAAVYAFMDQCEAAGIFQRFEPSTVSMQAKLLYDLSDSSKHMFIWTVTMHYKSEPHQSLLVDVDDETGQILCVSYSNYQEYSMDGVWERNKTVVDAIIDIYFTQLGLSDIAGRDENMATDVAFDYNYNEVDGGVTEAIYVFPDSLYGEFIVQFTVDGAGGFSTSFLK